ncbi:DgyrCDS10615 [Dimorphilus gyrociliatus]|nr:DgyrCDS10615 [Dimorphilus gyrociliatus]
MKKIVGFIICSLFSVYAVDIPINPQIDDGQYIGFPFDFEAKLNNDAVDRTIFLFNKKKLPEGRIDEIYANFISEHRIEFQVWRATGKKDGQSSLIGQFAYKPTKLGRVVIRLTNKIYCKDGDMLAFLTPDKSCPLGYKLSTAYDGCFLHFYTKDNKPKVNDTIDFDILKLPYTFSFGVGVRQVSTGTTIAGTSDKITKNSQHSTTSLLTPEKTPKRSTKSIRPTSSKSSTISLTTKKPVSMPRSTIRSIGQSTRASAGANERILGEIKVEQNIQPLPEGSQMFLFSDLKFPTSGIITSFWMQFINKGVVMFQIWRPNSNQTGARRNYTLVYSYTYNVNKIGSTLVALNERWEVKKGDTVGVANPNEKGVYGYTFDISNADNLYYLEYQKTEIGENVIFPKSNLPYRITLAIKYQSDDLHVTKPSHPTKTQDHRASILSESSPKGNTATESNERTPTKSRTTNKPSNQQPVKSSSDNENWWNKEIYHIIILVLLSLMFLLLFIICCTACYKKQRTGESFKVYETNTR